ncbi:MAG TPA: UbiA family prenyltransferase [Candidatus Didemnitutus sp.]|nr:UbiA family prenyltransferase [Candidatus Didemnitutus sp.]
MATALDRSVITCDMEGVIDTFSDGAVNMFGYDRMETVGKLRVSAFSPGQIVLQNLGTWLSTAVREGEWLGETNFIRKNGEVFGARIRITPTFKNGVQVGYCGVTEELDVIVDVPIRTTTKAITWLVITRAPFLTAALTPAFIGVAYVGGVIGLDIAWMYATLAIVGVALLHLASNVFNDYFDVKSGTDQANTKYFVQYSGGSRAIEMGLIDLNGTRNVAIGLAALAVAIGIYLTYVVGIGVLLIGISGLALGYFYTAPPLRLVARKGLGEIVIGMAFGPLITLGMYYVCTGSYSLDAFLVGIPTGLLTTNILLINQIPDAEGDAKTGKNHLVVTYGYRAAVWFYLLFLSSSIGVTTWLGFYLNKPLLFAVALIGLAYGGWIVSYMRQHLYDRTLVKANVSTIYLQILFASLFALSLLF